MVLSGHEHNFQHSHADGIDYFVTGGGGKIRPGPPTRFAEAHTVKWASAVHFLLVRIDGTARGGRADRRGRGAAGHRGPRRPARSRRHRDRRDDPDSVGIARFRR